MNTKLNTLVLINAVWLSAGGGSGSGGSNSSSAEDSGLRFIYGHSSNSNVL